MNAAIAHVLQFFDAAHLPPKLISIVEPFAALARITASGSDNPETTIALRYLLLAKDAAVRAVICEDKKAARIAEVELSFGEPIIVEGDSPDKFAEKLITEVIK